MSQPLVKSPRGLMRDYCYAELRERMHADGLAEIHTRALWNVLMRDPDAFTEAHPRFLPPLVRWLQKCVSDNESFELPDVAREIKSADGLTTKLLLRLQDGAVIETVVMRYDGRQTACLSTQAGCAMGCVFCATGQGGFVRHLSPGEIVGQVLVARRWAPGLRNLVLMGMGEPLHNYDAVMKSLEIITDTRGINIGPSRITISTVGLVPGIRRMALENRPFHLALSLHAATDDKRSSLIPINRRWPLSELMGACREYASHTQRRICVEWTLIEGENDSADEAARLVELLEGLDAQVNLIPLNPTGGYGGKAAESEAVRAFQGFILDKGFPCTVRQRRGIDVAAGCGQLAGAA